MAFKMNYSKGGFPYQSSFKKDNDDKGVYATVDGAGLTFGEYQIYDKTGKMPSDYKSRIGKDVDLSSIVSKEQSQGIFKPKKIEVDEDELLPGDPGYVEK